MNHTSRPLCSLQSQGQSLAHDTRQYPPGEGLTEGLFILQLQGSQQLRGEAGSCPGRGFTRAVDTGSVTVWFREEVYPLWAAGKEQGSPWAFPPSLCGGGGWAASMVNGLGHEHGVPNSSYGG